MSKLVLRDLTCRFGAVTAVDRASLAMTRGEFVSLLGPSGCGKTTTLRMIAGFLDPTEGAIELDGRTISAPGGSLPPEKRGMSMIFQSYAIWPNMTVAENVGFGLEVRRRPRAEITERVDRILDVVRMRHLRERYPAELSGGQQQRVALARAIVVQPDVLLLDEPLSNLDANLRALAREELKEFQRRVGTTTIYVTHDQVEAMGLGDRIAVLEKGRVQQVGTPYDIYHEPANTFVATFVGSPPMNLFEREGSLVGFRPEHLLPEELVAERDGRVPVKLHVERVEYLGSDRYVYGTVPELSGDRRVISRLPFTVTTPVDEDTVARFAVGESNLRFFDRENGARTPPQPLREVGA